MEVVGVELVVGMALGVDVVVVGVAVGMVVVRVIVLALGVVVVDVGRRYYLSVVTHSRAT